MAAKKAATTFADYLKSAGSLAEEAFIGLTCMYSFRGTRQANVTRGMIEKQFADRDLDPNYIPPDPTSAQAFLNATGEKARGITYKINGDTFFAEMKAVGSDRETITRSVMSYRVVDKKHLEGREVATLTFFKQQRGKPGSERVRFSIHDERLHHSSERPLLEEWLTRVHQDYAWFQLYLYDQPIRQMVQRYIEERLNGIKVLTSGGCYFVHRSRWDELRRLAEAVTALSPTFALNLCPLPDLPEMRSMVIESYQDEIVDDVTGLIEKIEKFRASGRKVTGDVVQEFSTDVRGIASRAEEHSRVLDVSQDRTAGALESAYAVLAGLASQIES